MTTHVTEGNRYLRCRMSDISERKAISDRICNQINYGLDLVDRISKNYKPEDTFKSEVLEYIADYEDIRAMFSTESLDIDPGTEGIMDTVVRVIRALWAMLCKLWDNIRHCFHYMFSSQYRAQSNIINYRKQIALCGNANDDKFQRYEVDAYITYDEFKWLISSTNKIVDMLEGIVKQPTIDAVDNWVRGQSKETGMVFEDNHFVDQGGDIPYKTGTYGGLGWSIKKALDATAEASSCVGRQVKLKNIMKSLDSDISDIRREINNKVERGATSGDLETVEKKLAYKTKMFQMLQAGLLALTGRLTEIDTLVHDIAEDADDIANGRYGNDDD